MPAELFYYRTESGMEVDLVIQTGEGVLETEAKSRDSAIVKDVTGFRSVAQAIREEWFSGIVVYIGSTAKVS